MGDLTGGQQPRDMPPNAKARAVRIGEQHDAACFAQFFDEGAHLRVAVNAEAVNRQDQRVQHRFQLNLVVFSLHQHRLPDVQLFFHTFHPVNVRR